jgi:hypothetical protein
MNDAYMSGYIQVQQQFMLWQIYKLMLKVKRLNTTSLIQMFATYMIMLH